MSMAVDGQPVGRTAIADLDAERRVLGILIRHPELVDAVADRLRPAHFSDPAHRRIYEVIEGLYHQRGRISYTQIYNQLRREGDIPNPEQVLISLTEAYIARTELEPSVEVLLDRYGRRLILEATERIREMILNESEEDLAAFRARAQELIFQATTQQAEEDVKSLLEVLNKCYLRLVERREGKRPYGLPVMFPAIDVMTTGFKNKDLIILAARPSMGKTSLALNFAVNVARRGVPVLIFSLEMDDEQVGDRIVLGELFRFRRPDGEFVVTPQHYSTRLDDDQFAKTQSVFNELHQLPIFIIDQRGLSAADIRAKARKVKAEHPKLGLIIIDYLQLIKPPTSSANRNHALIVGDIVREIRDLAGELDLPIILLSQLNRGVESRDNKRPMMSDLRDSGNIEEFADVVMFLYRDDYYYPERAKEEGTEGVVEVIFAKQRKGPTGTVKLKFIRQFTRFVEEEIRREPPPF